MKLTEETFIKFTQGNPRAFQAIFDCYRMRVFYFVRKLIDDPHAAEEITADTFVKVHRLHTNFPSLDNLVSFLIITAKNAGLDYIKQRKLRGGQLELTEEIVSMADANIPTFGDTDVEAIVLQCIYEQIEQLPPRAKKVFKLFYFEKLSYSQIAEKMNISPQTAANQKKTALKQLRAKVLEKHPMTWTLMIAVIFSKN